MTSESDELKAKAALCAKAMLLLQEAARAGHKLAISEDGHCSILAVSEAGKRKADMVLADLDNCEPKRARTLVDNPEFADRVLHVNGSFYHAHSQLLIKLPNATLMAQYSVHLAKNAHFLNADELYGACVSYLGNNWREVQKLNCDTFATE
jgi:hypothetical protein